MNILNNFHNRNKVISLLEYMSNKGQIILDPVSFLKEKKVVICESTKILAYDFLEKIGVIFINEDEIFSADALIIWGVTFNTVVLEKAMKLNKPIIILEDGFIRSIFPYLNGELGLSFIFDSLGVHFSSAIGKSVFINELNSDYELSIKESVTASKGIRLIFLNEVSKYNYGSTLISQLGSPIRRKVLVLDQAKNDMSVILSNVKENVFETMLNDAIKDNPDSDIFVKIHPEQISGFREGYFSSEFLSLLLKKHNNLFILSDHLNPISLLKIVNSVYCVSTQMGFEAAIFGKDVFVYGCPFYAGWGFTNDKQKINRNKSRSIEEVFYFAYIKHSTYYDRDSNSLINFDKAVTNIVNKRDALSLVKDLFDHQIIKRNLLQDEVEINLNLNTILNQTLLDRDQLLVNLDQILIERDQQVVNLDQTLIKRDHQLANLNQILIERDQQLVNLDQILIERDQQVVNLDQILIERDQQVVNLDQILIERDQQVVNLDQILIERDQQLVNLDQILIERDQQVVNLDQILIERDQQVVNLDQILIERDQQVVNLDQTLIKRDHQLANLNQILIELDQQLNIFINVIENKDQQISDLFGSLKSMKYMENSFSWRFTLPFRKVRGIQLRFSKYLKYKVSLINSLLIKSIVMLKNYGFKYFLIRLSLYLFSLLKYKIAEKRIINQAVYHKKNQFFSEKEVIVSFIIPVYDRTDILKIAIDSALSQNIVNIEVIIVTDGSPVDTISIINEYLNNPRVRIFNYPCSSGNAVRGRNKGILEARGFYIAFLDSDDISLPDRLEKCLPILENGEADVVYGAWQAILDGTRAVDNISNNQIIYSPDANIKMLIDTCIPCQSTVILKKSLFEKYGLIKPNMKYREDHELWARLAFNGAKFKSVPNVLSKLRLHSGNNELNFKESDSYWFDQLKKEYKKNGPLPKKIAFILPGVGISGGIAVVFKHAALLMESGHDVFVINIGESGDGKWFTNNPVPIVHIFDHRSYIFNGIDLLIATGWNTVEWLDRFNAKRKLYFVQSDERRFYDDFELKRKVEDTYRKPYEYFTEAHWIKNMLKSEFGNNASYVPNGIDTEQFFPDLPLELKSNGRLRVLIEGPIIIPFKGVADSYAAIADLNCDIWIVSSSGKPPKDWKYSKFFEGVSFADMRKIYSSCDIFLKMSRVEGFFGPPMEAMACGCSVVVGKVTGYDEYIVNEVNSLVVEQGDIVAARNAVERLLIDKNLRGKLIQGGFDTVKEWSWNQSHEAMLNLVFNGESESNV